MCNSDTFQPFPEHFNIQEEQACKIVVVSNGAFHAATSLCIPGTIALLFLLPYSAELELKLFKAMEELQQALTDAIKNGCTNDTLRQLITFICYPNLV